MWKGFLKNLKLSESYISMVLGLLVVVVIGVLLFNFFSGRGKPGVPTEGVKTEEKQPTPVSLPTSHTVASGENLWLIAEKYFNSGYNWVDIARENKLTNPDYVEVGQVLAIPKAEPILPVTGTDEAVSSPITGVSYTVVTGDNLWDITVRAYGDGFKWVQIAQANNLANPDLIHAGNVLTLPK
ncbi:MAG: LysM domain-containing protein [Microgenomates group bacterium LiPW_16]|nr:MAG: LysM domain-containing protein [Microgenomates group bacterium LiPW_16]